MRGLKINLTEKLIFLNFWQTNSIFRFGYVVYMLDELEKHFDPSLKISAYYDVACKFVRHLKVNFKK